MSTFAEDIERAAGDEPIEAITVAFFRPPWDSEPEQDAKGFPAPLTGKPVPWADVRALLDYEYDDGYGGADCHAVYAWTPTRVLFVHEYDGSTSIAAVPRNPSLIVPEYSGGGCE